MSTKKSPFSPFLLKGILGLLLTDEEFREKFFPILSSDHFAFDNPYIYKLAKAIWLLYDKYGKFPSLELIVEEVFKQKGKNIGLFQGEPSKEEIDALKHLFLDLAENDVADSKYIEENLTQILGFLAVQKIIIANTANFQSGRLDVEEFTKEIMLATSFSSPINLGLNLLDDLDKRTDDRLASDITPGLIELNIPYFARYLEEGGLPPGSLGFFLASTNGGKCHITGTKILMYSGKIKEVQDIVVGDVLMGPDSQPKTVLSTTSGIGPTYMVIPKTGEPWGCNNKHILTLQNCVYSKQRDTKNREIIDISVEDFLKKGSTFQKNYKLFIPDQIEFPLIEAPSLDPYFLGLWFGDGTKNLKSTSITSMDSEIISAWQQVASEHNLAMSKNIKKVKGKESKASTYRIYGPMGKKNPVTQKLFHLVGPNRLIPDCIKYGSIETRLQFLAGFVDTDGYIHHGAFEIIQKRKDYVEDLAFIARSLGLRASYKASTKTIKKMNFSGQYWRLCLSGEISKIPVRLTRKKHSQLDCRKGGKRTGFILQARGPDNYFGFTLDGDGRYLLGDFTVTHNSASLIQLAHDAAFRGHNVLYVTNELSLDMAKRRFDACFTGIPIHDVKKSAVDVREAILASPVYKAAVSRLHLVEVPTGVAKVSDIEGLVEKLKKKGFNSNLLVIDYADNLRGEGRSTVDYRHQLTSIYKDLRGIAQKYKTVVWTASQMNDSGTEASEKKGGTLTVRHVNEARGKIHIADLCLGIARTQDEKDSNTARLVMIKNRLGSGDGAVVQISTRFDISRLFDEEKNIVPMSSLAPDQAIEGMDLLSFDDVEAASTAEIQSKDIKSLYDLDSNSNIVV